MRRGVGIDNDTAPQVAGFECIEVKPGDNPKVIRSTFEHLEQIGVYLWVGVNNGPVSKDDLIMVSFG